MSHYEARLEADRNEIRSRVEAVATKVEQALADAVHALLKGDRLEAADVALGDHPINREIRRIDGLCHAFVARHLPSAQHLRFVSSTLRLDVALERVGDYAVTIAREAAQLDSPPPELVARDVELLSSQSRAMLGQASRSFVEGNAELARGTMAMDSQVTSSFQAAFDRLIEQARESEHDSRTLFNLLIVYNRLGRVASQAKNICEEALFTYAGETKKPKVYRILMVDGPDNGPTLAARAYAAKHFEGKIELQSAGWQAAEGVSDDWAALANEKGLPQAADEGPSPLDITPAELASYHVIISLEGNPRPHLGRIPFHSTALEWQLPEDPSAAFDELRSRLGELVELLRGDEEGTP